VAGCQNSRPLPRASPAEGCERLVSGRRDRRRATQLDDRQSPGDRRGRLDHERDAPGAASAHDPEESVERGAVDEDETVEIENDRAAVRHTLQLVLEVVDVREVELTRERDQHDPGVDVRDVVELESRHRLAR
jgi:hypothetical protein